MSLIVGIACDAVLIEKPFIGVTVLTVFTVVVVTENAEIIQQILSLLIVTIPRHLI